MERGEAGKNDGRNLEEIDVQLRNIEESDDDGK
jgi:hypothetical protein